MDSVESHVRLFDLVMSLSTAADLVSPAVANHGKRVAYIALCLARQVGLPAQDLHDLALAGALHDIGALGLQERMDLLQFELEDPGDHAERGYLFLSRSRLLGGIALTVRYHHQIWGHGAGVKADGIDVPALSHILHLADRIDVAILRHVHPLSQVGIVIKKVVAGRDSCFAPYLVDAFEELAKKESFWLDIVSPTLDRVLERQVAEVHTQLNLDDLLDLAQLFSHIVDFKSPFTSTHSAGVAASAEALAKLIGFEPANLKQMRIAGYLHDLGKLAVPGEILEKPEALTKDEFDIIRCHTYYTRRILETIPALAMITEWAASHHERLDGEGYPDHASSDELILGSRIVSVADVFTALAEDRPYRPGMPREQLMAILHSMVFERKLDPALVDLLSTNFDEVNGKRLAAQELAAKEYLAVQVTLRQNAIIKRQAGEASAD
jgi:HD-GYP domain-containing protein (c-di-GMP phosphodiesterase class II)